MVRLRTNQLGLINYVGNYFANLLIIYPNSQFCYACLMNKEVETKESAQTPTPPPAPHSKPIKIPTIALLTAVLLMGVVIFFLMYQNRQLKKTVSDYNQSTSRQAQESTPPPHPTQLRLNPNTAQQFRSKLHKTSSSNILIQLLKLTWQPYTINFLWQVMV